MRKPNSKGCIPMEDVCMEHCMPRICRHGCIKSICQCKTAIQNKEIIAKEDK